MSVILDFFTMGLAVYALFLYLPRMTFPWRKLDTGLAVAALSTYLIAQSGWSASYYLGNLWGALYNNYIWFIFNTIVVVYIIRQAKK